MPTVTRHLLQTETDDQGQRTTTSEGGTTKERAGTRISTQENPLKTTTQKEDIGAQITFTIPITGMKGL